MKLQNWPENELLKFSDVKFKDMRTCPSSTSFVRFPSVQFTCAKTFFFFSSNQLEKKYLVTYKEKGGGAGHQHSSDDAKDAQESQNVHAGGIRVRISMSKASILLLYIV